MTVLPPASGWAGAGLQARPASSGDPLPHDGAGALDMETLLRIARQSMAVIVGCALVTSLVAAGITLSLPRKFTSNASFIIQGTRTSPNLAGLASQFGISVPTAEPRQSPAFFGDLLRSRKILEGVAGERYCAPCDGRASTLALGPLLGVSERDSALQRDRTVDELLKRVSYGVSPKTGVVAFSVTTGSSSLAQQIAAHLLDEVSRFNLGMRQNDMMAERRFQQRRLDDVAQDLRQAEANVTTFLAHNRNFGTSPELTMQLENLRREASVRQQLYVSLAQAVAQARMEEGRDTPVLAVVDPPSLPARPDPRGLLLRVAFAAVLGAMVGLLLAVWRSRRVARDA